MSNWMDYSSGFPPAARLTRLVPFFKEGKIRAATSQGIWEAPLYNQNFTPVAQPIALDLAGPELSHPDMPVQLDSYSIVNQNGAQWEWSFSPEPYYVSNKNIRNPHVQFKYNGSYDVTLKVTNREGKSHVRTIKNMIVVKNGVERPNIPEPPKAPEKEICLKSAKMDGVILPTKIIISSTNKDGNNLKQYNNGFIKMESTDSPFVITRLTNKERSSIKKPIEGMLIWNIDNQCLELYRDSKWECITQGCDE
ncbi:PKD domain-containing protein [Ornithobacterium rhinotracheale]|uniref:PKD domain-containing protein n=1 Tax=Ornithobacterium rhinotracheale TaxID=28251 RepID=UPI0040372213